MPVLDMLIRSRLLLSDLLHAAHTRAWTGPLTSSTVHAHAPCLSLNGVLRRAPYELHIGTVRARAQKSTP